ncbi:MAG: hypothetical protein H0T73_18145 [Ardenticatenales bacterium]|nr:hypothetical protein [Ardenticatenales bacterium]
MGLHSIVRWLVVLLAIGAVFKFAMGWLQKMEYKPMDRGLMSGFTGLMDLQLLLGIILLVGLGSYTRYQMEHSVTMLLAVGLAHLPMRWRNSALADDLKFRNNLFVILGVIVLVLVAIAALPGNRWDFNVGA